jgi:cytochrome bd-type quinol oxidase subunit 2
MRNKIKKLMKESVIAVLALGLFSAPVLFGGVVSAQDPQKSLCQGATDLEFGGTSNCQTEAAKTERSINDLIAQIINIFSVIVGVVAVIMIIYGGFRYITSGGDSGNITSAKNTILYAIVGLVIVALAQFIVKFVLSKATSGNTS